MKSADDQFGTGTNQTPNAKKRTSTNCLERSLVKHLGVDACDEWSAMSVPLNRSEDTLAVLLNDCHTVERQRVTVMEEYWHIPSRAS